MWKFGGTEGRSPSLEFDSAYYLETNPSVVQARLNPLLHYLRIGRFEGRSTLPEGNQNLSDVKSDIITPKCIPSDESWSTLSPRKGSDQCALDVIVPVYKGRAETLHCLYSVLNAGCKASFELIVINDASPDTQLVEDLQRLAGLDLFTLLDNERNQGFVRSVNRGMGLHSDRDVVLLNADTEVFDGWLDRLQLAANRKNIPKPVL